MNAGIPIKKEVIIRALKTGKLYPYCWPPNYGIKTHREVCHWAGVDPGTLPQVWPENDMTPYPDIGISYRAFPLTKSRSATPCELGCFRRADGQATMVHKPMPNFAVGWVSIPRPLLPRQRTARQSALEIEAPGVPLESARLLSLLTLRTGTP